MCHPTLRIVVVITVALSLTTAGLSLAEAQPRVVARAPTSTPAIDPTAGWKLRFTPTQIQQLRHVGCRFDAVDRRLARRFAARGFSAEQYVWAYLDVHRHEHVTRSQMLEWTAYKTAGLPQSKWKKYHASGRSLTEFYNREIVGGLGMCIGGWVVFGLISVPMLITGVALAVGFATGSASGGEGLAGFYGGMFGGIFVVSAAIGLPLGIIGIKKLKRWVKKDLLDTGSADELRDFRLKRMHRTSLDRFQLRLAPVISKDRKGLALGLTF